jgi:Ca2+/Na+ antiporter
MGWVALIFLVVLIYFAVVFWQISLILAVLGIIIYIYHKDNKDKKASEEALRREQQQYELRQQYVHQALLGYVTKSTVVFDTLPAEINIAENALYKAEEEFADGAFAPFWDAVEVAATHLAKYYQGIELILLYSNDYKKRQNELDSTPPEYRLNINRLPDATRAAERMQSIVRHAQKNFQFATIYEQRKTNQLLVAGFQNLGQALSEMTFRIESSMEALSQSFSVSMSNLASNNQSSAKAIQDQLASESSARRDHERRELEMLDNIQRRRKPFP